MPTNKHQTGTCMCRRSRLLMRRQSTSSTRGRHRASLLQCHMHALSFCSGCACSGRRQHRSDVVYCVRVCDVLTKPGRTLEVKASSHSWSHFCGSYEHVRKIIFDLMQDPVARMLSAYRMTRAAHCRGARHGECDFPTFAASVNATLARRRGDPCLFQTPVRTCSLSRKVPACSLR